jgi:hypothetical protein
MGAVTWSVDGIYLAGAALAMFVVFGFRRGVQRELLVMVAIGLSMLLASLVGAGTTERINRLYKAGRFVIEDALARDPSTQVWERIQALRDPLAGERGVQGLALSILVVGVVTTYAYTQRRYVRSDDLWSRVLGALAGGVNGLLLGWSLLQLTGRGAVLMRASMAPLGMRAVATDPTALLVLVVAMLLIAFGLHSASGRAG